MFSSELDRAESPIRERSRGIVLGSIVMVGIAAALVSARTIPFSFFAAVAGMLAAAAARGQLKHALPQRGPVIGSVAAFLLYALISSAWAVDFAGSAINTSLAILAAIGSVSLMELFAEETRPNLLHFGEGLWIGFLVGLAYLAIEIATGQSLKIWLYNAMGMTPGDLNPSVFFTWSGNRLVAILRDDLNRNMAALTLFLWPAVMAIKGTVRCSWVAATSVLTVTIASAVVLLSDHESSKFALLAGLAAFACAHLARRAMGHLAAIGWVCACLAVLPATLIAHRLDLHNATWLQPSARHRIIIWNYTAEQVLKTPLFGVGARSTYVLGPHLERTLATPPDEALGRTLSTHSHNVYLQTWFELGLVGATLLTLLGLSIVQAIRSLTEILQPYAYATFASAAIIVSSSYGMWQIWFIAMFGLCAAYFALGANLILKRETA